MVLHLDVLLTGSANDLNLLKFRTLNSGEFQSLRARLDLIPVPYLLDYRVERKIYQEQVSDVLRDLHIAPHVPRVLALWGVMTRLRQPNASLYGKKLEPVLRRLRPVDKAGLYAYGRVPEGLSSEQRRAVDEGTSKVREALASPEIIAIATNPTAVAAAASAAFPARRAKGAPSPASQAIMTNAGSAAAVKSLVCSDSAKTSPAATARQGAARSRP